eukprot:TRINITY_DN35451_c0_g1_i1.p1 TRINITY_DN35451_c0_g1~~TRINITY_DN35451_c0_g1_i1.p1  ORF type:complete len:943 (+),score=179.89 TRINITY_DN35451_c0_g1_i1:45-2873(+)
MHFAQDWTSSLLTDEGAEGEADTEVGFMHNQHDHSSGSAAFFTDCCQFDFAAFADWWVISTSSAYLESWVSRRRMWSQFFTAFGFWTVLVHVSCACVPGNRHLMPQILGIGLFTCLTITTMGKKLNSSRLRSDVIVATVCLAHIFAVRACFSQVPATELPTAMTEVQCIVFMMTAGFNYAVVAACGAIVGLVMITTHFCALSCLIFMNVMILICLAAGLDSMTVQMFKDSQEECNAKDRILDGTSDGFCTMDLTSGVILAASQAFNQTFDAQDMTGARFQDFIEGDDAEIVVNCFAAAHQNRHLKPCLVTCRALAPDAASCVFFEARLVPFSISGVKISFCVAVLGERRICKIAGDTVQLENIQRRLRARVRCEGREVLGLSRGFIVGHAIMYNKILPDGGALLEVQGADQCCAKPSFSEDKPLCLSMLADSIWNSFHGKVAQAASNMWSEKAMMCACLGLPLAGVAPAALIKGLIRVQQYVPIHLLCIFLLFLGFMLLRFWVVRQNRIQDEIVHQACSELALASGMRVQYLTKFTGLCRPKGSRPYRAIAIEPVETAGSHLSERTLTPGGKRQEVEELHEAICEESSKTAPGRGVSGPAKRTESCHDCLPPSAVVQVQDSHGRTYSKTVGELQVGDLVLGYDHLQGSLRHVSVTSVESRFDSCDWVEVSIGQTSLAMTGDHPVRCTTEAMGLKKARNLMPGDMLRVLKIEEVAVNEVKLLEQLQSQRVSVGVAQSLRFSIFVSSGQHEPAVAVESNDYEGLQMNVRHSFLDLPVSDNLSAATMSEQAASAPPILQSSAFEGVPVKRVASSSNTTSASSSSCQSLRIILSRRDIPRLEERAGLSEASAALSLSDAREAFAAGSKGHGEGNCRPCRFQHRYLTQPGTSPCQNFRFCEMCHDMHSEDYMRRKRGEKYRQNRSAKRAQQRRNASEGLDGRDREIQ